MEEFKSTPMSDSKKKKKKKKIETEIACKKLLNVFLSLQDKDLKY